MNRSIRNHINFELMKLFYLIQIFSFISVFSFISITWAQELDDQVVLDERDEFFKVKEINNRFDLNDNPSYFCIREDHPMLYEIKSNPKYHEINRDLIEKSFNKKFDNHKDLNSKIKNCLKSGFHLFTTEKNKELFSRWENHIQLCKDAQNEKDRIADIKTSNVTQIENENFQIALKQKKLNRYQKILPILRVLSFVSFVLCLFFLWQIYQKQSQPIKNT